MSTQTFAVGQEPRLILAHCQGDLAIETWDERVIEVESDDQLPIARQEGDALTIEYANADLRLRMPADTTISAERVHGDVEIQGVSSIVLDVVDGDCRLSSIDGAARLRRVGGDLNARDVGMLELDTIGGDAAIANAQTVALGVVGGDAGIKGIREALLWANIGGDLAIQGSAQASISGGSVGGDLAISGALSIQIGDVGGDSAIEDIDGELRLGNVGGDAAIQARGADMSIGNVGGDLELDTIFLPDSVTRLTVGGDAEINLPGQLDLTIRATVGGEVRGQRMASASGGMFTIVYGTGSAQLELTVGGDLDLRTRDAPRTSSSSWGWDEHSDFAHEMRQLGEEMGRLGEELGRELSDAFGGGPGHAQRHAERARRRAEERMRATEERIHRDAERARRHGEAAGRRAAEGGHREGGTGERIHVRINDREWRFDPERLERLKQQAREAARAGIAGAMEAVERALAGIGIPPPPPPPAAPSSSAAPPPPPATPPPPPATGATIRIDTAPPEQAAPTPEQATPTPEQAAPTAPPDIETERAAILQMVAEGRISPEEGDMLLDALG